MKKLTLMYRWSVFTGALIAAFWAIRYQFFGPVSTAWAGIGWLPIDLYKECLPTWAWAAISHQRWADVLIGPIWVCAALCFFPDLDDQCLRDEGENYGVTALLGALFGLGLYAVVAELFVNPQAYYILLVIVMPVAGYTTETEAGHWPYGVVFTIGLTAPLALFRGLLTGLAALIPLAGLFAFAFLVIRVGRIVGPRLASWLFLTPKEVPSADSGND